MAGKDSTCVFPTEVLQQNDEELRIVMVGKTGTGKSATGNTILGHQCFESKFSATSQTNECSKGNTKVDGQKVAVIDTPGLFDTRCGEDNTNRDINQCISYCAPGPHIFLVIIRLGRFTEEEKQTVQNIQEVFGEAADRYSMVLFTHGDLLKNTTIQKFIRDNPDLQELVGRCNGQYHVFNNNEEEDRSQVTELLEKIRNIVQKNGGSHYTNEMFQEAERLIEEEKQRILKEKEKQIREEREELEKKLRAEYEEKLRDATEMLLQAEEEMKEAEKAQERERGEEIKVEKEEREKEWRRREEEIKMEKEAREKEWRRREEEIKMEKEAREKEWRRREEEIKVEKEEREQEWRRREEEIKNMKQDEEGRKRSEEEFRVEKMKRELEDEDREKEWKKREEKQKEMEEVGAGKREDRGRKDKEMKSQFYEEYEKKVEELDKKHQQDARQQAEKTSMMHKTKVFFVKAFSKLKSVTGNN